MMLSTPAAAESGANWKAPTMVDKLLLITWITMGAGAAKERAVFDVTLARRTARRRRCRWLGPARS